MKIVWHENSGQLFPARSALAPLSNLRKRHRKNFLYIYLEARHFPNVELIAVDLCDFIIKLAEIRKEFGLIF